MRRSRLRSRSDGASPTSSGDAGTPRRRRAPRLTYGFDTLGLDEIVSFTYEGNLRSRAVMERIGMTHDPADDFEHPALPADHRLRKHVLYRADAGRRVLR